MLSGKTQSGTTAKTARKSLPGLLLLVLALFPSACVQLAEIDSSQAPEYRSMIGQRFELKEEFLLKGVKRDLRSKTPDYFLVVPRPGVGGPEFFDLGVVPRGSEFEIVGVVTHESKLFPMTAYVVRFANGTTGEANAAGVRLNAASGFHLYLKPASPQEAPPLNPRYFQAITASPLP